MEPNCVLITASVSTQLAVDSELNRGAVERRARLANSRDLWDGIWKTEGEDSWRQHALDRVYKRIKKLLPPDLHVLDIGGGAGLLARTLTDKVHAVTVCDHSESALEICRNAGLTAEWIDLEATDQHRFYAGQGIVATEVLEHLSDAARRRLLIAASGDGRTPDLCPRAAIFSVPNNRLGPEEEPQHTIKWTALEFLNLLREYWGKRCRVEVMGPFLLGVCGNIAEKPYTLSVTFPARDEAADIEATLASFRGVADEMVIGIDYRTQDNTREIAERYAEVVFDINDPEGPPDDRVENENPVHFSHCRNTCMRRCTSDWIFMTEAHERLGKGQDILLNLDKYVPDGVSVGVVTRTANARRDTWPFEWLCRNDPDNIYYIKATHNHLTYPENSRLVLLTDILTIHERAKDRDNARKQQRKTQNRLSLMEDWLESGDEGRLLYLGFEWRGYDPVRTIHYLEELLVRSHNGPMKYMARLVLARTILQSRRGPATLPTDSPEVAEAKEKERREVRRQATKDARAVLMAATDDDWQRTEHFCYLGDMAYADGKLEQARQFWQYASVRIGHPPLTQWWYDGPFYTYLPAQRLAMVCGELGLLEEGLSWAQAVSGLLPDDAPDEVFGEARDNVRQFEQALAQKAARAEEGDSDGSD